MKAIVQNRYGSPHALELKEVAKPTINDDGVLVKVHAISVNVGDYFSVTGVPWMIRFSIGFPRPRDYVPGWDIAGYVESVGRNVTRVKPGDAVFGTCEHAFAEYTTTSENSLATKPANLTFEQAAAVPTAALTALQGIRDKGKVRPGQRVLVNGASGGVGSFAIQIAKTLGAEVTGVCSSRNVEMVRALGADHVVDYTNEDFTRSGDRYDLILDNVANKSFSAYRRALAKGGLVLPNSGHGGMSYVMKAALLSIFMRSVGRPFMTRSSHEDFITLKEMLETGKLKPVIDRTYTFPEIPEAIDYVGTNRARGKVVITMK